MAVAPAKLWSFCRRKEPWIPLRDIGCVGNGDQLCCGDICVTSVLLSGTSNPRACRALISGEGPKSGEKGESRQIYLFSYFLSLEKHLAYVKPFAGFFTALF